MKRLIVFMTMALLLIAGACKVDGQVTARQVVTKSLNRNATYYEYTGVAGDTLGTEQDTLYFTILPNKHGPVNVSARVEGTRTGSTDSYDIDIEGKVFANDSWAKVVETAGNVASVSMYQGETALVDSTGVADAIPASGINFYRYFRVACFTDGTVAVTDKFTITAVLFKIYERR